MIYMFHNKKFVHNKNTKQIIFINIFCEINCRQNICFTLAKKIVRRELLCNFEKN